jgi:hypothetical protein
MKVNYEMRLNQFNRIEFEVQIIRVLSKTIKNAWGIFLCHNSKFKYLTTFLFQSFTLLYWAMALI